MQNTIKYIRLLLVLLLVTKCGYAQDFNILKASDAVTLQLNDSARTESRLMRSIIVLHNNLNILNVRLNIPYHSINNNPGHDTIFPPGLSFNLKVNIDPIQIQKDLTSTKTFVTHGFLTLNNITKPVIVEYIPLLAGTELNGNFNISMIIQFNPGEFKMEEPSNGLQCIIKISDTPVNRI